MGDDGDPDRQDRRETRGRGRAKGTGKAKGPPLATAKYLERAGLAYIDRFAPPRAGLVRVLRGKVARSARVHGSDPEEGEALVQALAAKFAAAGLLNDAAYALARARRLLARGHPRRVIAQKLRAKGLEPVEIDTALARLFAEEGADDLAAALTYARKRRLGPFGPAEDREARRPRDLATLARRGFSYEIALRALSDRPEDGEGEWRMS